MNNYILSKIYIDVYNDLYGKLDTSSINQELLEKTLEDYLISILGLSIKNNYDNYYREIRKYFENILVNTNKDNDLIDNINIYKEKYINLIDNHYYTKILISALEDIYSPSYDGRVKYFDNSSNKASAMISHDNNSLVIGRIPRKDEMDMPYVYIKDIDLFEKTLENYIETISISDSFYNILNNENLKDIPVENKIKAIFTCAIFNASNADLVDVNRFFIKYTDFISDNTLDKLRKLNYVGNILGDEVYCMLKRSELEYETPYSLCFMLRNNIVELPYIRLGISNNQAYILSVQSSQSSYVDKDNEAKIDKYIKSIMPKTSAFRFFNPSHLVSILMCFGILKSLGINEIYVSDYLPFRYRKTIIDKQMSEEEADNFQKRLTDKNIYTYLRLVNISKGINVLSYPDGEEVLKLDISSDIILNNQYLQELFDKSYEFGNRIKDKTYLK